MADVSRPFVALVVVAAVVACSGARVAAQSRQTPTVTSDKAAVNPTAAVLADFQARLDKYVELQRRLAEDAPLEETEKTAEITVRQELLASKIQHMRRGAKRGDIFTPEIAALFRRLLRPELKGPDGNETRAEIRDDAPTAVPLTINGRYPASQPLSTVPPNVLARLPRLPEDVDYRFVGPHLVLRDVDANIIVDYIPHAIR